MQSEKKKKTPEAVTVQVGIVEAEGARLKRLKGRTLPLQIHNSSNAANLLNAAVEKHSKHFKQFSKHAEYVLLYPDTSQVITLPGSLKEFSLSDYKRDLGKAYSKIYFYLCSKTDFEMVAEFTDAETDDDELVSQLEVKEAIEIHDNDQHKKKTPEAVCPSCFRKFPMDVIDTHANLCIGNRFDPIGDVSDTELFQYDSDPPEQCFDGSEEAKSIPQNDQMEKMKDLINECASNVEEVKIRINVRRKEVFNDYLTASQKQWFNNKRLFKITFVGEPAVDDGGPRREFFSGY